MVSTPWETRGTAPQVCLSRRIPKPDHPDLFVGRATRSSGSTRPGNFFRKRHSSAGADSFPHPRGQGHRGLCAPSCGGWDGTFTTTQVGSGNTGVWVNTEPLTKQGISVRPTKYVPRAPSQRACVPDPTLRSLPLILGEKFQQTDRTGPIEAAADPGRVRCGSPRDVYHSMPVAARRETSERKGGAPGSPEYPHRCQLARRGVSFRCP
jgi:hypothetical protein